MNASHREINTFSSSVAFIHYIPSNTEHSPTAVLMLAQRLRRWLNIKTAVGGCHVFAGMTNFA